MKKIAVIIYGPPGSGKSTQSDLVAHSVGLIHFDTGRHIESVIRDPKNANDETVQRQKQRFETGLLCEKPWVLKIVYEAAKQIIESGYGLVLSGSPRTLYESFGDEKAEGVYSLLERGYGKENIHIFFLKIDSNDSIARNKERKICTVCGKPLLYNGAVDLKECPFCKGPLRVRVLDKPEIIKERIEEFKRETEPIFDGLKNRGYEIHEIDGQMAPYKVLEEIKKWLA